MTPAGRGLVLVGAQGHLDAGQGPGVVEAGGVHEVLPVAALPGEADVADDQGLGRPAAGADVALGGRVRVVAAAVVAAVVAADLAGAGPGAVEHVPPAEAQLHQEEPPLPLVDQVSQVQLLLQPGVAPVGDLEGVEGDLHADAAHVAAEGPAPLAAAGQTLVLQEGPQVGGEDLLHLHEDAGEVEGGEAQPPVPGGRQEDAVAGEAQLRLAVGEADRLPRLFPGAGAPAAADPRVDGQLVAAAVGEVPVHEDLPAGGFQADLRGRRRPHQPLQVLARVQLVGEHQDQAGHVALLVLLHLLQAHLLQRRQGDLPLPGVGDLQLLVVHREAGSAARWCPSP